MASVFKIPAKNKQGYKWKCVMEGPPDPVTGKRQQVPRVRDTQKEAIAAAQAVVDRMKGGTDTKRAKKMKFNEAAEEWLETYSKSGVKDSTIKVRIIEITILNKYLANVNIDSITHHQYQRILNDMDKDGYARNTILGAHSTANMIFKWCLRMKFRIDNPGNDAVVPVKKQTITEIKKNAISEKYLDRAEIEEFLEALKEHGLQDDFETFYFLLFTGVRPGEFCALQWSDIDFESRECHIFKTIYYPKGVKGAFELTPPKTSGSVRIFDLDEFLINMLKNLKVRQQERIKRYKELHEDYYDGDFIFSYDNGWPYIQDKIIDRMRRLLKKTNIKKNATPHIFRHTHITMLIEASLVTNSQIDLKTIMRRVGHEDAKTTLKIYTHITEQMRKNTADRVRIHFNNILNPTNLPEM
ncbi:tyrosine-type recombinase/integrase [Paenibacillus sp. FSL L8-0696]|jgi:integrase|uniref:tyrosine-type recombinase/integrase n=1 Tax=Paenibacillus sp. FSL L8-0696 TaxID=2954524 RepID=UPI003119DEA8